MKASAFSDARRMHSPQTLNARAEYCGFVATFRQQRLVSARSSHYFAA